MKNLNEAQLSTIEMMAELFYSPEEIAINIEVDPDDFTTTLKAKEGDAFKYYMKGWLQGDITLRRAIAKAAENGSSPAQQMMREYQLHNKLHL